MNFWKTILLALVVAGVGYYIAQVEIPKDDEKAKSGLVFPGITRTGLVSLVIRGQEGELKLQRNVAPTSDTSEDDIARWKLAESDAALDPGALTTLIAAITTAKRDFVIPASEREADLSVYGLVVPALTLTADYAGMSAELLVGKENEYLKKRYMKLRSDDTVFVADGSLLAAADKKRDDFRDRTPIEFFDSQLERIELTSKKSEVAIEVSGDLIWKMVKPVSYTASSNTITELLRTIRNMQAAEFVDQPEDLSRYNLGSPHVRARLFFRSDLKRDPIEVSVGQTAGGETAYMRLESGKAVYKLTNNPVAALTKDVDELRERQLVKFQFDEVTAAEFIPQEGDVIKLDRQGEQWSANGKAADGPFVKQLLDYVQAVSAVSFPHDTRDYGFATPLLTWKIQAKDEMSETAKTVTLVIGGLVQPDKKERYAGINDLSEAFIVDGDTISRITPRIESLRKVEAVPSPTAAKPQ